MEVDREIEGLEVAERSVTASPVSPVSATSSQFIGRWRHKHKLMLKCWPKWKLAYNAIQKEKLIPINGMRINEAGKAELWHQKSGVRAYVFEISDDDFDLLTSIPKAGAEMGKMVVHAPGSSDEKVKKECWVEVPVTVYPKAFTRKITPWGMGWNSCSPRELFGESIEDAFGLAGMAGVRTVFVESDDDIDEEVILREVVENNAYIVLGCRPDKQKRYGVTTEAGRRLIRKASYWVVPGRKPWEDGGELRGYQFADRIVRWIRRIDPSRREEVATLNLERMHASTRAKGVAVRRTYFLENTVTRFAERVGMSRQRVMARFLDDGIVEWLLRSVDNVKSVTARDAPTLLRGRVTDAVNALEFYYRAIEGMGEES